MFPCTVSLCMWGGGQLRPWYLWHTWRERSSLSHTEDLVPLRESLKLQPGLGSHVVLVIWVLRPGELKVVLLLVLT